MTQEEIEKKIIELENELQTLRNSLIQKTSTVNAPDNFKSFFNDAEESVHTYFKKLNYTPSKGCIEMDDERYILVRASALSYDFFHTILTLYSDKTTKEAFSEGRNFLFDLAYAIGKEDAKRFHTKLDLKDPIQKLSAGPVYFAYTGWASVHISPESNPISSDDFYLKYNHPYSFEADSWIKNNIIATEPVCVMNAAYSAAWCQESFNIPLSAVEITCRAKGDEECTFVMAPPHRIKEYIQQEKSKLDSTDEIAVPFFFERKVIEEQLRTNEQLLNDAQEMAQMGSWYFNLETEELKWTDELYKIFEIPNEPNPNLYQDYLNRFSPDELPQLHACVNEAITHGKSYQMRHSIIMDHGKLKWLSCSGLPVKNKDGKITALKGVVQDITDKITKEIELDSFFEVSIDLMCIANDQGYFVKLSPSWSKLLGYTLEELYERPFVEFVHPDDLDKTYQEINNLNDGGISINFENRYRCKNGEYVTLSWKSTPNNSTGLIYCTTRDITAQKKNEEQLLTSITEKEILLKEIHHRVKNNLQIISSLLSLQAKMNGQDENLSRLYEDSMNRIKSMSSLHELFYQSINTEKIDFNEYVQKLCTDLINSFKGDNNDIHLHIDIQNIRLNIDTAVPLGLIVNEVLTNSLKHGFTSTVNGEIYIKICREKDSFLTMNIGDNGKGFSTDNTLEKVESMGLSLLKDLAEQLEGNILKTNHTVGTHYVLHFVEQNI